MVRMLWIGRVYFSDWSLGGSLRSDRARDALELGGRVAAALREENSDGR